MTDQMPTPAPSLTFIYVVGAAGHRPVKIGKADDVQERLRALQVGSPYPLRILLAARADRRMEYALHDRFRPYRRHGEWFDFGDLDPVAEVALAVGQLAYTLDDPARSVPKRRAPLNSTEWYVASLREAGVPDGLGRDRLKHWARTQGVPLPGKATTLAAVVAALKAKDSS